MSSLRGADIRRRLLDHGFQEEFRGDDAPPVTRYYLGKEGAFFAEFLAPLLGAPRNRAGRSKATIDIGGVTAQRLRHLDLLLMRPWKVDFGAGQEVQIPNPPVFLAQKLLIHEKRLDAEDRAKDILYIHDTLEIFGPRLEELHEEWWERIRPAMPGRTAARVTSAGLRVFKTVSDDIRRAVRIPADRRLSPEELWAACRLGLDAVFGEGG